MLTLDPLKLALVALVAVVVLGPDKLPDLARRAGALMRDLQRFRASLANQAHQVASDLGLPEELRRAPQALDAARRLGSPDAARQALLRAAGLEVEPAAAGGTDVPPGSIDLGRDAPQLLRVATGGDLDPAGPSLPPPPSSPDPG